MKWFGWHEKIVCRDDDVDVRLSLIPGCRELAWRNAVHRKIALGACCRDNSPVLKYDNYPLKPASSRTKWSCDVGPCSKV